jgi:hypothetical protein
VGEGIERGLPTDTRVFKLMGLPSKAFDSDGYCGFQRVVQTVDGGIVEIFIDYVSECSCSTASFLVKICSIEVVTWCLQRLVGILNCVA